ncbi:MAG TPA: hypothetical protein VFG24_00725 [Nitrosopumilaceae archaeon]|nr:hypothetical protein [Nitrosopumilaceae archaeon]
MTVLTVNIGLVILGIAIPIGMVIFWSKVVKILGGRLENKSHSTILNENAVYNLSKCLYRHRSKFNILMISIITIIEFLALIPF